MDRRSATITIKIAYEGGTPTDIAVSGKGEHSGKGQLAAAGALIANAANDAGVTPESGVLLMAQILGWDTVRDALMDASMET